MNLFLKLFPRTSELSYLSIVFFSVFIRFRTVAKNKDTWNVFFKNVNIYIMMLNDFSFDIMYLVTNSNNGIASRRTNTKFIKCLQI